MSINPAGGEPVAPTSDPASDSASLSLEETLAERAYRLIEDQIIRLVLPPGIRLTEQELAARLDIGRTPVREGLQRLVNDGLVVVFPRKGIAVSVINPLDVLMALEVRSALERLMAGAAARRANPQAKAELTELGDRLAALATGGDLDAFMQLDKTIHRRLGEIAGNPFLVRALAPLEAMTRRARFYFLRDDDLQPSAELNRSVIRHVVASDCAAAEQAAEALVDYLRNGIKRTVVGM
jgi:DNA-binding GntR family transcriptional regulator